MKGSSELTNRQKEVLRLLASGLSHKQIAAKLNLSVKTIDDHRAKIMAKLNINNLPGLVKYAIRTGLTSVDR
jgi:DNA-binding NarL/FixJ family response regulator